MDAHSPLGFVRYSLLFVFLLILIVASQPVLAIKEPKVPSQHEASFAARAFALQNILQALITQGNSNAKYLSPKLRADVKRMLALHIYKKQDAASAWAVTTTVENSIVVIAQGAAASFLGYFF